MTNLGPHPHPDPQPEAGGRRTSHPLRLTLLVLLLVLLVAATATTAFLAATRPVPAVGVKGEQQALQRQRENVMALAEQFMLRVNTYGPDLLAGQEMPEYRSLVKEVITPKFAADFEQNVPAAEQTVAQAGLARSCKVFSTGVSAIDADSATALVAGSFTNSYPGSDNTARVETEPAPFRVEVSLVRIRGAWLVDDFTPLTGESDQATPSELPSIVPPASVPSDSSAPSDEASP